MKKVLWISRHEMTTAQLSDLERIMGGTVKLLLNYFAGRRTSAM